MFSVLASQQRIHRSTTGLAHDVPAGDLQRAYGRHDSRAALVLIPDHVAYDPFYVERVFSENTRFRPFM